MIVLVGYEALYRVEVSGFLPDIDGLTLDFNILAHNRKSWVTASNIVSNNRAIPLRHLAQ